MATLHELGTIYTLEDAMNMLEAAQVMEENTVRCQEYQVEKAKAK